jgi:16S rRNA (guanine527-N7)-methyltransferase
MTPFDVVSSRAFASLADFTRLTQRHLAEAGIWMAMKGKFPDDEITALPADVDVFHVEPLIVPELEAERCLVWMRPRSAIPSAIR